jgi:hypothetical protein
MSIFKRPRGNGPEARTLRADEPECQGAGLRATVPSGFDDDQGGERAFAPHCDQRILHAPGECWACDMYPDWQALRGKWGIAFTGQAPLTGVAGNQLPCPADFNRPLGSKSDHRQWGPNTAQGPHRG